MSCEKGNVISISNLNELKMLIDKCNNDKCLLILDTYASWCGPCKLIAPFFAGLSINKHFNDWVVFAKVDVDEAEDIVLFLEVSSMPTFYLFGNNSSKPIDILQGANKDELVKLLLNNKELLNKN